MTRMKRDQPAVSLLVPVYNVEKYLSRCLESARDQTLENIEVICINDGSTDRSPEIIREFVEADARFRSVDKENSGYGASMNMGLRAARGKYVGILESDDFIEPQFLEILFNTAEKNKAEVVKSNFFFYWSSPKEKNELFELVTPSMANRLVSPQEEQDIFYLKPSIWSAIYRRDFLLENSIDFLETPGASYQDAGFNFKVWASAVRAVYLHEAYLHYRQDNESSSVNSRGKIYCVCDEYREMERYLEERPAKKACLEPVLIKMRYDSYMWNYERLAPEFQLEFLECMSREFNADKERGALDFDYFEPWKIIDLNTIIDSPELYHAQRTSCGNQGRLGKTLHYYRVGGLPLLAKIARSKLGR